MDRFIPGLRLRTGACAALLLVACGAPPEVPGPYDEEPPREETGLGDPVLPPGAIVFLLNDTRSGDRVVAGVDAARELPGGTKSLQIRILPETGVVTLQIRRSAGAAGSATFQSTGSARRPSVRDGDRIVLVGGEVSDQPVNMVLEATGLGVLASFSFTVFRMELVATDQGVLNAAILPASVRSAGGTGASLLGLAQGSTDLLASGRLGHNIVSGVVHGGLVLQGVLVPSGIPANDFSPAPDRGGFEWVRSFSSRIYGDDNCLSLEGIDSKRPERRPLLAIGDGVIDAADDTPLDLGADLVPGVDNERGLAIWLLEAPVAGESFPVGGSDDVYFYRTQFFGEARYDGVKVSVSLPWYWRFGVEPGAGPPEEDRRFIGDNDFQANATTLLTRDLMPRATPDFRVVASTPAAVARPAPGAPLRTFFFTISGSGFATGQRCEPVVYWINDAPRTTPRQKRQRMFRPVTMTVTDTLIRGTFSVAADDVPGDYTLKVLIEDQARSLPRALRVDP